MAGAAGHKELLARIRLLRSANVGPISYFELMRRFGSAQSALDALPDLAGRGGAKTFRMARLEDAEREIRQVEDEGASYLLHDDPAYPFLLRQLENAPPILIYRGAIDTLAKPMVAMVGARNASAAACRFAREMALQLAQEGMAVVSGLARGIDTAAHQGALAGATTCSTVGAIASGIDISYPPENDELQHRICADGLVLAEQPPGTEPLARHFPFRNRIIAGLSLGTLVVEAAPRSGSLITARLAGEFGREVLAIPGSPLDPRSRGCNELIRNGAALVQSASDIIEHLSAFDTGGTRETTSRYLPAGEGIVRAEYPDSVTEIWAASPDQSERQQLSDLLGMASVSVDELVRQSGLAPGNVHMQLLELEIAGRLERHAGGKVSLRA